MRCHTTWERTEGRQRKIIYSWTFLKCSRIFMASPGSWGLSCARVQGTLHTSHRRNVNNGMRERTHDGGDTGPDHLTRARRLDTALLHATTPSLLHPLNYRLTWTSWAMRLIIKWTWSRHRANNIGVWRILNYNKLQRAGSPHSPNIRKLL